MMDTKVAYSKNLHEITIRNAIGLLKECRENYLEGFSIDMWVDENLELIRETIKELGDLID